MPPIFALLTELIESYLIKSQKFAQKPIFYDSLSYIMENFRLKLHKLFHI